MAMEKVKNPLFLYGISALITGVIGFSLSSLLDSKSFIYSFLFRSWPIQFLSTWLFLIGIIYWIQRYSFFKREEAAFQKIRIPKASIPHERAEELIRVMPDKYKQTLTLRRFRELLQAFLYGEEIVRLNEELSRRDMAEVERGHLILNNLRTIIPVIGFLGTVLGLSLGIVKFPEVSDVTLLKTALKDFAASLSVAFDTTLLALGYTIVIIILTAFLRQREETLVSEVDGRARNLIGKIKFKIVQEGPQYEKGIEQLPQVMKEFSQQMEEAVREIGEILSQKFDGLKDEIHRPPQYRVVVQPIQDKIDEDE